MCLQNVKLLNQSSFIPAKYRDFAVCILNEKETSENKKKMRKKEESKSEQQRARNKRYGNEDTSVSESADAISEYVSAPSCDRH